MEDRVHLLESADSMDRDPSTRLTSGQGSLDAETNFKEENEVDLLPPMRYSNFDRLMQFPIESSQLVEYSEEEIKKQFSLSPNWSTSPQFAFCWCTVLSRLAHFLILRSCDVCLVAPICKQTVIVNWHCLFLILSFLDLFTRKSPSGLTVSETGASVSFLPHHCGLHLQRFDLLFSLFSVFL